MSTSRPRSPHASRPPSQTADPSAARRSSRRLWRALPALLAALALAVLAGCATASTTPTQPPMPSVTAGTAELTGADVDAWLDGRLPAALAQTGIAGATVAVVHDGEVLTTRGYGWADTGDVDRAPVPVDPDRTLFRPGSVSKLLTATAVMQLVESGEVDLDADVTGYLDLDLELAHPVTLRQLLTHTAGFEERVDQLISLTDPDVDLRRALATDPPEQVYLPGTVPAYSNYGNALAGYVVEQVSGEPFAEYVRRTVLEPAGMTTATFEQPLPPELQERMSRGYPTTAGPAAPFEYVEVAPAGGLSASARDMAGFMLAQLGASPTGRALLEPATLELMQRPALDDTTLGGLAGGSRMTLGFFEEDRNGHRVLGHGGDTQFFHSQLELYPEQRSGIFVSLNSNGAGATDTVVLRESLMQGFADRYLPAGEQQPATGVDATTARRHADVVAGTYHSARSMHSTFLATVDLLTPTRVVPREDGRLLVSPGPGGTAAAVYEEVRPWVWQEVGGRQQLTADVVDGRVRALGQSAAFALLPFEPLRAPGLALPLLGLSALVLTVGLAGGLVAAVRRRRRGEPAPGAGRARVLTRAGAAAALLALAGWAVAIAVVMGLQPVPAAVLRALQVLQVLGVVAVVPATVVLVAELRGRRGLRRVVGAALVLLALGGTAWFAVANSLVWGGVSY